MKRFLVLFSSIVLLFALNSCGSKDHFEKSIYSEQPEIGLYQDYLAQNSGLSSEGTDPVLAIGNEKTTIKKSGLFFKDSDGDGKLDPYEDWRLTPTERATDLVSQMSVKEKAGLLSWLGESGNTNMTRDDKGTEDKSDDVMYHGLEGLAADGTINKDVITAFGPGTALAYSIVEKGSRYVNDNLEIDPMDEVKYNNNIQGLTERAAWGIPMIISSDPAHFGWDGDEITTTRMSKWPYYMGLGAASDIKTTKAFGKTVAEEYRMMGHQMLLGPQADIATEPRWGRIQHLLHSNGDAAAKQMKVLIKAMQGGSSLQPTGIATTIKHIPGAGSNEEGMDSHTRAGRYAAFPGNNLDEHLKPFQAAIDAGAAAVMAAYSIIDIDEYKDSVNGKLIDEGSAFSKKIMTDLLKTEMGFEGVVLSDWGIAEKSAWGHEDIAGKPEVLAEMMNAGTYQYGGKDFTEMWLEAYELDLISEETINSAVTRALELQFKLGLFENPYVDLDKAEKFWDPNGEALKARFAAGEKAMKKAMVLVENPELMENLSLLPLNGTSEDYINSTDTNGNGTLDVFFDSAYPEADSGQAKTQAISTDKQYLGINFVDDISKADIAIIRVFSRGTTYFGSQGGTPLSYDTPMYVYDRDKKEYTDEVIPQIAHMGEAYGQFGAWKFTDWSNITGTTGFVGQGFMTYLGASESKAIIDRTIKAKEKNPNLKIILGTTNSRPLIVSDFIDQIDGYIIDFAATDDAFLDVVFYQDGNKPGGRLPVEIPSSDAAVEAQLEDIAGDSADSTYEIGFGLNYPSVGGYGS